MTKKFFLAALVICLSLFSSPRPTLAQDAQKSLDNDVLTQLQSEGWRVVKNGLLQRELRAGEVESFVFGVEGFTWKLQDLQRQVRKLQAEFKARPTPELRKAITGFRQEIANTQKMIVRARAAEALGEAGIEKVSCALNFAYNATAGSGASVQGTWGNASANFTGNCGFTGEVYATAYAKTTVAGAPTTQTVTDGPRSGANVSATAYASRNGGAICESTAYASMTSGSLNPSSYTISASNSSCPPPQNPAPGVTVTASPTSTTTFPIYLFGYDCVDITWTTGISPGNPPYTTTMYRNNVSLGLRTSYAETICNQQVNTTQTITIRADVTDANSLFGTGSTTSTIRHHNYTEPCVKAGTAGKLLPQPPQQQPCQ